MPDVIPVIPVGPGEYDALRAARVIDSLARHEADLKRVVLLVDGVTEAALRPKLNPSPLPLAFVENPRRGRGSGVFDGLACGLTAAFRFIADQHPGAHVWKIDSDALVLRRTSDQIAAYFAASPGFGLTGTFATNPGGTSREAEFAIGQQVMRKFLRPVWYWRTSGGVTSPYVGKARRFAKLMRDAHAAGLPWGWHVQGGSYGVNGAFLDRLKTAGRLDAPENWLGCPMSEDQCFTHWAILQGFTVGDFNRPGDAFGIKAAGLPMPVDELIAANYGVVHSLKTGDWASECALADELIRRSGPLSHDYMGEGTRSTIRSMSRP